MKKHRASLALGILALMASTFQQEAVGRAPVLASHTDQKTPQAAQPDWREFRSRQGGFSVLMPGTPQEQTEVKEFPEVGGARLTCSFSEVDLAFTALPT